MQPTAGCRIIPGGPASADLECQLPFFVNGVQYDSCAEVKPAHGSFTEGFPFAWGNYPLVEKGALWCLKSGAQNEDIYDYGSTLNGGRYAWGLCECYTNAPSQMPSAAPSSSPLTEQPTPAPSTQSPSSSPTIPPTLAPSSNSPTTYAPVVDSSLEAVVHSNNVLQKSTETSQDASDAAAANPGDASLQEAANAAKTAVEDARAAHELTRAKYLAKHSTPAPTDAGDGTNLQSGTPSGNGDDSTEDDAGTETWVILVAVLGGVAFLAATLFLLFKKKRRGKLKRPGYTAESQRDLELQKNLNLGAHGGQAFANPMGSSAPFDTFLQQIRDTEQDGVALAAAYEAVGPKTKFTGELCGAPYAVETHIRDGRAMVGQHRGTRTLHHADGSAFKERFNGLVRITPRVTSRGMEVDILDHNTQSKCTGLMEVGRHGACVIKGRMNDSRDAGGAGKPEPTFVLTNKGTSAR